MCNVRLSSVVRFLFFSIPSSLSVDLNMMSHLFLVKRMINDLQSCARDLLLIIYFYLTHFLRAILPQRKARASPSESELKPSLQHLDFTTERVVFGLVCSGAVKGP